MLYSELVDNLAKKWDMKRSQTREIVEYFLKNIMEIVDRDRRLEIRGFGVFEARQRKQTKGRIPGTGREVEVPPRSVPTFKPAKDLKESVKDVETNAR
ncbi:MAG: HU family DNA-binding protein [bacterium]